MMIGTNNIISKSGDGNEEIGFGGGGDDDESDGNNGNSQYPGIRLVTKFYGARKLRKVDLDRMTLRTEAAPTKITNEALQMRDMALKQRLGQLGLSQTEGIDFNDRLQRTERFIREIRSTLLQTESRTKERQWLSMQTSGELDEKRLVESLTGQQNIYRRRAEVEPISGGPLSRPKIIWFCFDVSASMTRFQPHDQRLDRSMDVALMLCESFRPFQHKIRVQLSGHSGDSHFIQLAAEGRLPAEGRETWRLLETMKELSAHCVSGDTTLRAVEYAVANITKQPEEADEYLVVILSDANLAQYSIQPDQLTRALRADHPRVHASIVFIGSLLDQAERLMNELPAGHCFMCMQPGDLPRIVKNLLLS